MIRSNYAKGLNQGKPNRDVITGSSFISKGIVT